MKRTQVDFTNSGVLPSSPLRVSGGSLAGTKATLLFEDGSDDETPRERTVPYNRSPSFDIKNGTQSSQISYGRSILMEDFVEKSRPRGPARPLPPLDHSYPRTGEADYA